MSYILVQSFKEGLDTRRSKITAPQGSLQQAKNVHITRGGELEKRKAFVPRWTLPADTFGLHATANNVYTFGSVDSATFTDFPSEVTYQRLVSPTASAMTEVVSAESFNGLPYVVAKFADGNVHHFYNGVRVTAWDTISPSITSIATLATAWAALITADAKVNAAYSLVGSDHTITITGASNNDDYTITAETHNRGTNADNAVVLTVTQAATVSLPKICTIVVSGTYEAADEFVCTIQGNVYRITGASSGIGGPLKTFRGKLYTALQSLLYFSDVNAPTTWGSSGVGGEGFINMANQTGGNETLTGIAPYQAYLAVMSRRTTQVWSVDADPVNNRLVQVLDNIGTMAHRSAISFGEIDVFFLSDTGIRSLRARDSSNAAVVYDVGTSIDTYVTQHLRDTDEDIIAKACGVIEPSEGRYMLAVGGVIFVYSYFPASQISAWSTYETGFTVEAWAVQANQLYARSGTTVYLYGGTTGVEYDNAGVEVTLSWLDAAKPATMKSFKGIDLACDGAWTVYTGFEPRAGVYELAGSTIDQNFSCPNWTIQGLGTHLGIKLINDDSSYARISAAAFHFEASGTE